MCGFWEFPKHLNSFDLINKLQSGRFAGWIVCLWSLTLRLLGLESVCCAVLLWRSHLNCCYLTTSKISALWLLEVSVKPRAKKCIIQGKSRLYFDVGGRALNEGNNQSVSPRSHLKAYQVTLNDSVTMANNLTKTIVLSSSSPGQITNQSQFT